MFLLIVFRLTGLYRSGCRGDSCPIPDFFDTNFVGSRGLDEPVHGLSRIEIPASNILLPFGEEGNSFVSGSSFIRNKWCRVLSSRIDRRPASVAVGRYIPLMTTRSLDITKMTIIMPAYTICIESG